MAETKIGTVTHYFGHLNVAAVDITDGELRTGDMIHIKGHSTDFQQTVKSMEIEHNQVDVAKLGDSIGIQVIDKAREHDKVYKVTQQRGLKTIVQQLLQALSKRTFSAQKTPKRALERGNLRLPVADFFHGLLSDGFAACVASTG